MQEQECKNIDLRFTEKIIQQVISVPDLNYEAVSNLYKTSAIKLMEKYGVTEEVIHTYRRAIEYISTKSSNIRQFIRMLNSVFPTVFMNNIELNQYELFVIELFRFYSPELYNEIYRHSRFLVSQGDDGIVIAKFVRPQEFASECSNFYQKITSTFPSESNLMSDLFPLYKEYSEHGNFKRIDFRTYSQNTEILRGHNICDARYFPIYFFT